MGLGNEDKGHPELLWSPPTPSTNAPTPKRCFFFSSQIYSLPSPSQPSSHEMASRRLLYRKNTNLAGERKGSDPCPG